MFHHHHLRFVLLQTTWTARRRQRSAPHPRQSRLWSRWPRVPGVKVMSWRVYSDNSCLRPVVCSFCGCRSLWWKYTDDAGNGDQTETINIKQGQTAPLAAALKQIGSAVQVLPVDIIIDIIITRSLYCDALLISHYQKKRSSIAIMITFEGLIFILPQISSGAPLWQKSARNQRSSSSSSKKETDNSQ